MLAVHQSITSQLTISAFEVRKAGGKLQAKIKVSLKVEAKDKALVKVLVSLEIKIIAKEKISTLSPS